MHIHRQSPEPLGPRPSEAQTEKVKGSPVDKKANSLSTRLFAKGSTEQDSPRELDGARLTQPLSLNQKIENAKANLEKLRQELGKQASSPNKDKFNQISQEMKELENTISAYQKEAAEHPPAKGTLTRATGIGRAILSQAREGAKAAGKGTTEALQNSLAGFLVTGVAAGVAKAAQTAKTYVMQNKLDTFNQKIESLKKEISSFQEGPNDPETKAGLKEKQAALVKEFDQQFRSPLSDKKLHDTYLALQKGLEELRSNIDRLE